MECENLAGEYAAHVGLLGGELRRKEVGLVKRGDMEGKNEEK